MCDIIYTDSQADESIVFNCDIDSVKTLADLIRVKDIPSSSNIRINGVLTTEGSYAFLDRDKVVVTATGYKGATF